MNVSFQDDSYVVLRREAGHLHLFAYTFFESGTEEGERLNLILDTGAYMTVLSRATAITCGFDKLPSNKVIINGFGGKGELADFVRIPALKILNNLITDVPVLIPHNKESTQEVLGLNVLEYFNYYVNTENSRLYLKINPDPKPYDLAIACGQVFTVNPKGENLKCQKNTATKA